MIIRLLTTGLFLLQCHLLLASTPTLNWLQLAPLPDHHGFGGPFVGVHNGVLMVAGGANFPEGPPWGARPGNKVWHDDIYVLVAVDASWQKLGELPQRWAYGACLGTTEGLLLIGGEADGAAVDDVWRLSWIPGNQELSWTRLPSLPRKSSYLTAGMIGSHVFVAASHRSEEADRLDQKSFWSLDLKQPAARAKWVALPAWPGTPRHKAVGAVQHGPDGLPNFFLISGSNPCYDDQGALDLAQFEFYTDGFRYDPRQQQWHAIAGLPAVPAAVAEAQERFAGQPRAVAAACALAVGPSHLLVFSGATGRDLTRPVQERPLFPREVLAYDTRADKWSVVSSMPQGVVTTGVVFWKNHIVIPSGEIRPGVRTRHVQAAILEW
jgi:N-acetylneuraminic acid mutarotase